jgi:hypothetical protein
MMQMQQVDLIELLSKLIKQEIDEQKTISDYAESG